MEGFFRCTRVFFNKECRPTFRHEEVRPSRPRRFIHPPRSTNEKKKEKKTARMEQVFRHIGPMHDTQPLRGVIPAFAPMCARCVPLGRRGDAAGRGEVVVFTHALPVSPT